MLKKILSLLKIKLGYKALQGAYCTYHGIIRNKKEYLLIGWSTYPGKLLPRDVAFRFFGRVFFLTESNIY